MAKTQNETFVSTRGKTLVLFPLIPMEQFRFIVDLAQGRNLFALRAKLRTMSIDRILAFRYDMQRMQVVQHQITCFERVRAVKQRGAAGLYKASLATLVRTANQVLADAKHINIDEIFADAARTAAEMAREQGIDAATAAANTEVDRVLDAAVEQGELVGAGMAHREY